MSEYMTITLGGKTFNAELCSDEAPRTVAALKRAGRFDSFVFAANICSNEITWNTPVDDIDELENRVFFEDPGNVVYYPAWGAICVFFGPTEPAGWCTKIASILPDELEAFAEEADKVWGRQGGIVTTDFMTSPEPASPRVPADDVEALVGDLRRATEAMWLDKPDDVRRMIGRNFKTGKEFSCWAYCWGYLSNLGDSLYMVYQLAKAGTGDLASMEANLSERCARYSGSFIAAGHMTDTATLLQRVAFVAPEASTPEAFAALVRALQRYVMQLSFWVDIELPWAEVGALADAHWHARYDIGEVNGDGHITLKEK